MSYSARPISSLTLFTCFLQIGALNAFAVAQPVFDRVISNPQYLRLEGYSGMAVAAVMCIFLFAIPLSVTCWVAILRSWNFPRIGAGVFIVTGTLLVASGINIALRWVQWRFSLRDAGVPDSLLAIISLPMAIGCSWMYGRFKWPNQVLNLAAIGIVLFPLNLLSTPAMRAELLGVQMKKLTGLRADNPVPIVMIAFDGLCSMALLNERHEIDAVRYPAFARLAGQSTFYRNATSVHSRTAHALPAILTGQLPRPEVVSPVESEYPDNIFRFIHDTEQYDMTVFEPMTQLCPTALRQIDQSLSFTRQVSQLTDMLVRVYIATTTPAEFEFLEQMVPRVWFGIVTDESALRSPEKGLIRYSWDAGHDIQVAHFIRTLRHTGKPGFHFLHVVIPHDPWAYMPSGKSYLIKSGVAEPTPGTRGEEWVADDLLVNFGWQRYLLQLQFADRCLEKILNQLEDIDAFDRSLVIVVADHGMAFVPGQSRRTPANETLADLMTVPLFIKTPLQTAGNTTDHSVETIDVLPTIADVIQMPLPGPIDGASLVDQKNPERPRKTMHFDYDQVTIINPEFPERFRYVDRMLTVFGSGSREDRLWDLNTIPELVGQELSACEHGTASRWKCDLLRGGDKLNADVPDFVPCYYFGRLVGPEIAQPVQIAVALNGRIEGTTRTCNDSTKRSQWTALLRDDLFRTERNTVQFFEVERIASGFVLHEIAY